MKKEASENLKKVIRSAEMNCIRAEFTALAIACALCIGIIWPVSEKEVWLVLCVEAAVILTGFTLWRAVRICRKPGGYIFCSAVLYQPHRSDWRKAMYFTVVIEDAEGNRFPANTHAIFFSHSLTGLLLEDYVNQTVEVGYNEETGQVVVIG